MGDSGPPCKPIVLKWIDPDPETGGVPLTWADGPPPPLCTHRNGKSCAVPEHADFLDAEIAELVRCGVARPEAYEGEIIADYPMGVVPKHSLPGEPLRYRMIADERYINDFMTKWDMSMRTISSRRYHLAAGRFVVTVDLKSAYWHLRADKTARRYQGFGWYEPPNSDEAARLASLSPKERQAARIQRRIQRYVFECLPFGSRQSPAAFGKLVRQLERRFEARGIDTIFYCDDLLFVFDSAEEAVAMMEGVIADFDASGMSLNWPKCSGVSKAVDGTISITPLQRVQFLGFIIDLSGEFTTIAVTDERKAKAMAKIDDVLRRASCGEHIPARDLASVAGSLASMSLAFGDVVRRRTRDIHAAIGRRRSWDGPLSRIEIGTLEADELRFLRHLVETSRPSPLFQTSPILDGNLVLSTDAGELGFGAILAPQEWHTAAYDALVELGAEGFTAHHHLDGAPVSLVHAIFRESENMTAEGELTSSTIRELIGLLRTLLAEHIADKCADRTVRLWMDSACAVHILRVGSRVPAIQAVARAIWSICSLRNINLLPAWRRREDNEAEDALSKVSGEWRLDATVFDEVTAATWHGRVHAFDVDLFASTGSGQGGLPFCARFGGEGCDDGMIDAFERDWAPAALGTAFVFPPPTIIPRTLAYMRACRAEGLLVVPYAPSRPWWASFTRAVDHDFRVVAATDGVVTHHGYEGPNFRDPFVTGLAVGFVMDGGCRAGGDARE